MQTSKHSSSQSGQAALFAVLLLATASLAIGAGFFGLAIREQQSSRTFIRSLQTYAITESGMEDALLRLMSGMLWTSELSISLGDSTAQTTISEEGGTQTVNAEGIVGGLVRKAQAVAAVSLGNPQFFFGMQAGEGGVKLEENTRIEGVGGVPGNIYSNGPIEGDNGATITGDVTVAAAGSGESTLDDIVVLGTARANTITDSKICGDAHYQSIDASSLNFLNSPSSPCPIPRTPGIAYPGQPDSPPQNMPIPQANIDQWKEDAAAGGTIVGNCGDSGETACVIGDNQTLFLGPKKITGNLALQKKQTLVVRGTLHILGSISLDSGSGAVIKCDPSLGAKSCVIITDSWIHIKNNATFQGSGQQGSFLLMISTLQGCNGGSQLPQCTHHNGAVDIHNNATGAIFYAPYSLLNIHNGVTVTQATAYTLNVDNNTTIQYEQGLASPQFSSGPGGSFEIISWRETE